MSIKIAALAALVFALPAAPAAAHFVTMFTPQLQLAQPDGSTTVPVDVIFWHPLFTGEVLDMEPPRELHLTHGWQEDSLLDRLESITFHSWTNAARGFHLEVPVAEAGDYILSVISEPYFEKSEGMYIQQMSKTYLNVGHEPTEWYRPVGLPAEIQPLNRPYDVLVGSTFSGIVLSNGQPVAGAEIEVEYIAALPDVVAHSTGLPTVKPPALGSIITYSDAVGQFTFGIPKAGWWGFAALGVGPELQYRGQPLSQDAVIWIVAHEFGR